MTKYLLILSTLLSISTFNLAYGEKTTPDQQKERILDELIASKLFVDFPRTSFNANKGYGSYSCEFQSEDYDHPQGVYGSRDIRFSTKLEDTDFKNLRLYSMNDYRVLPDNITFLTKEECLAKANEIKNLLWPNIAFKSGYLAEPLIKENNYDWSIEWQAYETTQMQRRSVFVRIRKIDGKSTFVHGGQYKWVSDTRKSGLAVPYQEALNKANQFIKSQPQNANASLKSWTIDSSWGDFYVFNYQLDDKTTSVFVSADNGKATSILPKPEKSMVNGDDLVYSSYGYPHWTRQGLVFTSTQFRQSFDNKKLYPKVILRDLSGNFSIIYNVSNPQIRILFSAPWSDWIVISDKGYTYAINLANGQVKSLKSSYTASILDADLTDKDSISLLKVKPPLVATFAEIGSQRRSQLCLDSLDPLIPLSSRLPLNWNGRIQPCFSPNGKDVYLFSSGNEIGGKLSTPIRRIDTKTFFSSLTNAKFDVVKKSAPLFKIPNNVSTIQPYPEGNQLFIETEDYRIPAIIVDVKTLKQTSLTTEAILRKNTSQLSGVWNIYAGPKSGEITIYASTKKKVEQLFVCNLDGSNLRALTPTQELAVKYTNFQSGKSGFDVSKEIALHTLESVFKVSLDFGDALRE